MNHHFNLLLVAAFAVLCYSARPQVCLVVKTYAAHEHSLPVLLAGVFSDGNTRDHMRAIVVNTDSVHPFPGLDELVENMNSLIGFPGILMSPRTPDGVKEFFPELRMNDYGYLTSDAVLDDLLLAWANSRWPAMGGSCTVTTTGVTTECTGGRRQSGAGGILRLEHVIEPLPYAADAGLACDLLLVTNGDNVYASEMWSQVC